MSTILALFPDVFKIEPKLCKCCKQQAPEFGGYCLDCYYDLKEELSK
jgi:predicted amidophosphoribosyltransferase